MGEVIKIEGGRLIFSGGDKSHAEVIYVPDQGKPYDPQVLETLRSLVVKAIEERV